jgi:hypothetical protein
MESPEETQLTPGQGLPAPVCYRLGEFSQRGPFVNKAYGEDHQPSGLIWAHVPLQPERVIESAMHGSSPNGATWPKPSRHSGSSRSVAAVILSDNMQYIHPEIERVISPLESL